jgi:hypothetical protein
MLLITRATLKVVLNVCAYIVLGVYSDAPSFLGGPTRGGGGGGGAVGQGAGRGVNIMIISRY